MKFDNPSIEDFIMKLGLDNQGMLIIFLYSLLLIPKEKIYEKYKSEYDLLDRKIDKYKISLKPTYDEPQTKYIKHLRNAIGHGKVEYTENSVKFADCFRNKEFLVEIPLNQIGYILNDLQQILYKYIDDKKI